MYQGVLVEKLLVRSISTSVLSGDDYSEDSEKYTLISEGNAQRIIVALDKLLSRYLAGEYSTVDSYYTSYHLGLCRNEIVRTTLNGIGFILTPFCCSDLAIDVITDDSVKSSENYGNIMKRVSGARFNHSNVNKKFAEIYTQLFEGKVIELEPVIDSDPNSEIVNNILKFCGHKPMKIINDDYVTILYSIDCASYITEENAIKMSKILKKNIMFFSSSSSSPSRSKLDKELFKDYIFIYFNVHGDEKFYKITTEDIKGQPCLGYYVDSCYVPTIAENSENQLKSYDQAIRDNTTGVYFALRKKDDIFITVVVNGSYRVDFYDTLIKEVTRRLYRPLSKKIISLDVEYNKDLISRDRKEYIDFVVSNSNVYIEEMQEQLGIAIEEIGRLQRNLSEKLKAYNQYNEIIQRFNIEEHKNKMTAKATRDIEDIEKLPQVKCVFIKGSKLNIMTNDIIVTSDATGKRYDIGRFHIQLGMVSGKYDPSSDSIRIRNIKHPLKGGLSGVQDAPHVFSGGHLCQGNISSTITECYGNRDVYGLVSALIFFLESANTADGAGQHLIKWPEYVEIKEEVTVDETDEELENALEKGIK